MRTVTVMERVEVQGVMIVDSLVVTEVEMEKMSPEEVRVEESLLIMEESRGVMKRVEDRLMTIVDRGESHWVETMLVKGLETTEVEQALSQSGIGEHGGQSDDRSGQG